MTTEVTVSMYPSSVASDDNPFINILNIGLRSNAVRVVPLRPGLLQPITDALHVHWLERIFWGKLASRSLLIQAHLARSIVAAARKYRAASKPVVWTAHNLRPHDGMPPERQEIFTNLVSSFMPLVTDCIVMDESIIESVRSTYPQLGAARFHLIPHPNFTDEFRRFEPLANVRDAYNLPASKPLLVSVGKIRPYKGLPALVKALRQANNDFCLIIAGDGDKRESGLIAAEISGDSRFIFDNRTLAPQEVAALLSGADAAIFNFTSILNSGSVLSALSLSTPVICPAVGAMTGLAKHLGPHWVRLYEPPLRADFIDQQVASLCRPESRFCDLSDSDPVVVGAHHARVYRGVG